MTVSAPIPSPFIFPLHAIEMVATSEVKYSCQSSMYRSWGREKNKKQTTLAGFIKRPKVELNVECNEVDGESSQIPKESHQLEKESATVVQGCSNYETLPKEQTLMHILDHEANLDGQGSMKARSYSEE